MTHHAHKKWLTFTAFLTMSFGPIFLIGAYLPTADPARFTMEILGWTFFDWEQSFDHRTTRFLSALAGGFLFGWGMTIWRLKDDVYDAAPEGVRKAVVTGFCVWFVTDSIASIASGHPSNAGFNLFFLLIGIGPMWRPAPTQAVQT